MMLGGDNVVADNCLTDNGEYGFNGYSYVEETYGSTFTGGATNITFTGNDISGNNTQKTDERHRGRRQVLAERQRRGDRQLCARQHRLGWPVDGHEQRRLLVQGNYISGNDGEGLMYEISYNADIIDNTFVDNAIKNGAKKRWLTDRCHLCQRVGR